MLDAEGPGLLWQLQPLIKAEALTAAATEDGKSVGAHASQDNTREEGQDHSRRTLARLLMESGCGSVREWGTMECVPMPVAAPAPAPAPAPAGNDPNTTPS
eukprot:COSAG06_NODE_3606_length_5130_cov_11.552878_9_plen_101_part_00